METLEVEKITKYKINEKYRYPNDETIEAIREVENGDVIQIGSVDDFREYLKQIRWEVENGI